MKNLLCIIFILLFSSSCYGAELLVKAQEPWNNNADTSKMSAEELRIHNAHSRKGDIIVVRPDGWKWGKEECLPRFVVVKVPELSIEEAAQYEQPLFDVTDPQKPLMVRVRKYALPKAYIKNIKTNNISLGKYKLISKLIIKTGAASEVSVPSKNILLPLWRRIKDKPIPFSFDWWIKYAYATTPLLKTVKPSGGDYTSLEACMNANEQDLVANDKYFDVEIDGDWSGGADTTAVTVENYNCDATRYINIYSKIGDARHNGIYGNKATAYRLEPLNASGVYLYSCAFVYVNGLQILVNSTTDSKCGIITGYIGNGKRIWIYNNIIKGSGQDNTGGMYLADLNNQNPYIYVYNNIIYDFTNATNSFGIDMTYPSVWVINNTVYGNNIGIQEAGSATYLLINNICNDNTTDYLGNFSSGCRNNITNDSPAAQHCQGVVADSGTTDSAAAFKLIQSGQNFLTTCKVGMIIKNTTDTTYTYITAVDSNTQLSINDDIMANGENFSIYTNMYGNVVFVNETGGSENLHLDSTDTVTKDKGYTQYSDTAVMSSNSNPWGTALASSQANSDNVPWYAFNDTVGDKWAANGTTGWLSYYFPFAVLSTSYKVVGCVAGYETAAPKNWTFLGSNVGTFTGEETILDTQTNQTGWTAAEERTYNFSNTTYYKYYRLNISANNGHASYVTVCELSIPCSNWIGGMFSITDIDGAYRGTTWDIGADEYVAAATGVEWLGGLHNTMMW